MENNEAKTCENAEIYPKEFRDICLLISSSHSDYCIPSAIHYLLDQRENVEASGDARSRIRFAAWVDHFCSICLYPLESRMRAWLAHIDDIELLLTSCEAMAGDSFAEDRSRNGHIHAGTPDQSIDITCLGQRINVYFYTLHSIRNNQDECKDRLTRILSDTKNNISYLLSHKQANELFRREWTEDDSFYYPGMESWQKPLSWLYHESDFLECGQELVQSYNEYLDHLSKCECLEENKAIREILLSVASRRLIHLYQAAIASLEDDLGDLQNKRRCKQAQLHGLKQMQKQIMEKQKKVKQ